MSWNDPLTPCIAIFFIAFLLSFCRCIRQHSRMVSVHGLSTYGAATKNPASFMGKRDSYGNSFLNVIDVGTRHPASLVRQSKNKSQKRSRIRWSSYCCQIVDFMAHGAKCHPRFGWPHAPNRLISVGKSSIKNSADKHSSVFFDKNLDLPHQD